MRDEAVLDMAERGLSTSDVPSPGRQHMESQGAGTGLQLLLGPMTRSHRGAEGQQEPYCSGDL